MFDMDKVIKRYLESGAKDCPFCGSSRIGPVAEHGVRFDTNTTAKNHLECRCCKARWRDLLTVTGIEPDREPSDAWPLVIKYQSGEET